MSELVELTTQPEDLVGALYDFTAVLNLSEQGEPPVERERAPEYSVNDAYRDFELVVAVLRQHIANKFTSEVSQWPGGGLPPWLVAEPGSFE